MIEKPQRCPLSREECRGFLMQADGEPVVVCLNWPCAADEAPPADRRN